MGQLHLYIQSKVVKDKGKGGSGVFLNIVSTFSDNSKSSQESHFSRNFPPPMNCSLISQKHPKIVWPVNSKWSTVLVQGLPPYLTARFLGMEATAVSVSSPGSRTVMQIIKAQPEDRHKDHFLNEICMQE